jgi:hypothetical protein
MKKYKCKKNIYIKKSIKNIKQDIQKIIKSFKIII